jgi:hypothetical protein
MLHNLGTEATPQTPSVFTVANNVWGRRCIETLNILCSVQFFPLVLLFHTIKPFGKNAPKLLRRTPDSSDFEFKSEDMAQKYWMSNNELTEANSTLYVPLPLLFMITFLFDS